MTEAQRTALLGIATGYALGMTVPVVVLTLFVADDFSQALVYDILAFIACFAFQRWRIMRNAGL
jgi:hypothetical protein